MIFSAVVRLYYAVFLMLHIERDRLSLVKACKLASWLSCLLMKSGG